MNEFEILFGLKESQIKKTCILLPLFNKDMLKGFGTKAPSKGSLYACANNAPFTLIRTGVGAPFTGDAVLHLKQTPCENIILFGSCGLAREQKNLNIGSLLIASKAYNFESFSQLLFPQKSNNEEIFHADITLCDELLKLGEFKNIPKVNCATFGSLKLEKDYLNLLGQKDIAVVDMECSAFYAAANHINRRALAFFYVCDIIGKKDFYAPLTPKDSSSVSATIKKAAVILQKFAVHLDASKSRG